jgi:hypothetical protein
MKARVANCPSCAGPVEFQSRTSLVTVCDFCRTLVARGDKAVEDHGKVADLALTNSPLRRGGTGTFRGKKFELIGRVQYKHPAGGIWDEWYLSFPSGKWGWLAEAQGKYYLTFEKRASGKLKIPPRESLEPGRRFRIGSGGEVTVAEVGVAEAGSAEGEIPWAFRPGAPHPYADLHGAEKQFASIDYSSDPPRLFVGAEVSLESLELSGEGWDGGGPGGISGVPEQQVAALAVNCPNCAGQLKLHMPDETERIGCPHCGSLLDCDHGKLEYLQTLRSKRVNPVIPLGSVGRYNGDEYTLIGFMERFAMYEGVAYPWTEYLLHNPKRGFRWLVHNQRHWSFVEPLSLHEVTLSHTSARYNNTHFDVYDRGDATVRFVLGEFYWKVRVGERVHTADYIHPPWMISSERSDGEGSQELHVSLGTYLTVDDVEEMFGVENIARPWGVGMNQPKPQFGDVHKLWGLFALLMFLLLGVFKATMSEKTDGVFFTMLMVLLSIVPVGALVYSYIFEVRRWENSDYSPYAQHQE